MINQNNPCQNKIFELMSEISYPKAQNKENNQEISRQKWHVIYRRKPVLVTLDFSPQTMEDRRKGHDNFSSSTVFWGGKCTR